MTQLDPNAVANPIRQLPKAEVHVHLEGCLDVGEITASTDAKPGSALASGSPKFTDLSNFLKYLDFICGTVRSAQQLSDLAYQAIRRIALQGVRYADIIVNPTHWGHWSKRIPAFVEGLDKGFSAAEADGLPPVGICVSLLRTQSQSEAMTLVNVLTELCHPRVVALSIDGNEATVGRTGPRFAAAFQKAAVNGLRRTVHAGESSGPEGIRDAIELLRADRIDHGVRAIEDPELVQDLAERQIPLAICPSSNVTLGLYSSFVSHPLEALRKAGVLVSVNTDDPVILKRGLVEEYERCAVAFGWSEVDLIELARNSILSSFASSNLKQRLLTELAEVAA